MEKNIRNDIIAGYQIKQQIILWMVVLIRCAKSDPVNLIGFVLTSIVLTLNLALNDILIKGVRFYYQIWI